jgi:hypothetical protein
MISLVEKLPKYKTHLYSANTLYIGVGVLLALGGMSSPWSETEWANRFTGLYVHTTPPSVGLGPS